MDSWLSYKYAGRTIPTFERNEETLKVLRELSMANERADEENMIIERLEREACKELEAAEVGANSWELSPVVLLKLTLAASSQCTRP